MTAAHRSSTVDRYTKIGALSQKVRGAVKRLIVPTFVIITLEVLFLDYTGMPGAYAFALIGGSTCFALGIWTTKAIGLPLLPMMVFQSLFIYGIPIVAAHENLTTYPQQFVVNAGLEVLIFNGAMAVTWWISMHVFQPSRPVCYALREIGNSGTKGLTQLGFSMLVGATLYEVLEGLNLLEALYALMPIGSDAILNTLLAVASACGLFLVSMVIGAGESSASQKTVFSIMLVVNTLISANRFLLAAAAANVITVAIGLFWGSGRVPWRYLTVAILAVSFLNIGKTTMRNRYWGTEDKPAVSITIEELPAIYAEWAVASYDALLENNADTSPSGFGEKVSGPNKNQTLLDRIDNLQNMLFVIDATRTNHVNLLHGETYTLIPPLLIPRVLWPSKPRTHEGQVLLNVHFGRQDLGSTFTTYIAWGLLPEAYGNFGPIVGSLSIGAFLGMFFAWVENFTAPKLVVSMEGFLSLCLLMSLMNSFEMVASVLVTSTFQSMVIIVSASYLFVHRTVTK